MRFNLLLFVIINSIALPHQTCIAKSTKLQVVRDSLNKNFQNEDLAYEVRREDFINQI